MIENSKGYEKSSYSLEDLEALRDGKGFIDLTNIGLALTEESRNIIGNQDRIKNWVDFNGTKALLKGEIALDENDKNYGIYAELITEEIAKELGLPAAHYDLVKMKDEKGKEVLGVLSVEMTDENGEKPERIESLNAIIGNVPSADDIHVDISDYETTVEKLEIALEREGYSEENIKEVMVEYKKRMAFILLTADQDKHPENISFFINKDENGKQYIKLAPVFDSESALMLDMSDSTIEKLLGDYEGLMQAVGNAYPKIGVGLSREDGGLGEYWADTMDRIIDDDDLYDYFYEMAENSIDMDDILDRVENRIHAPLPDNVRLMAKYTVQSRQEEMGQVLDGSYLDKHNSNEIQGNKVLDNIKRNSEKKEEIVEPSNLLEKIKDDSEKASIGTADLTAFMRSIGLQMNFGKTTDKENADLEKEDEEK